MGTWMPATARRVGAAAAVVLGAAAGAHAQEFPLLDSSYVQLLSQEVSGDAAYEHIRFMSQYHRPRGSDNLWTVAEYFSEKAREVGLDNVTLIKQAGGASDRPWNARSAEFWLVEPTLERVASTVQSKVHLADRSRTADVTAELIDIGAGTPADYERQDVRGRIVLTYGSSGQVMREAVQRRGALGIVWYPDPRRSSRALSHPDQLRWVTVRNDSFNGQEPTFVFVLSTRQGVELSNRIAASPVPLRARATVDAAFTSKQGTEPWQVLVEAFVTGTDPGIDQDIVLTAHLQEEAYSANDDASGSASMLEIARALTTLFDQGLLPRPRRNIRFWWVTENSGERQYFIDHPDEVSRMWVSINQDMVGADQSQDVMRTQNVTRLPAMRFHFFNDVMEAVVEYMVTSNTAEIAQQQNHIPLYPTPHVARLGSMHRYNAKPVFFHLSTDHQTFVEAPIGIPAITFTNMPDDYIHTTDDDLWNIDRTQLGRNALAVALIAYVMATADERSIPALAAETGGRGAERMARNLRLAVSAIATGGHPVAAYHAAIDQMGYASERERRALTSLVQAHPSARRWMTASLEEIERRRAQAVREIALVYRSLTGRATLPRRSLSDAEERLASLRPRISAGVKEFIERRIEAQGGGTNYGLLGDLPAGLHIIMASQVLNGVDGRRTGLEIYRLVAAEAREAGTHYYGRVRPEAVLAYLQGVARLGVVSLN